MLTKGFEWKDTTRMTLKNHGRYSKNGIRYRVLRSEGFMRVVRIERLRRRVGFLNQNAYEALDGRLIDFRHDIDVHCS